MSEPANAPEVVLEDQAVFERLDTRGLTPLKAQYRATGTATLGPPALTMAWHAALVAEATQQLQVDGWVLSGTRERGEIEQHNRRARLGAVARAYLSSKAVTGLLRAVTGEALSPAWSASCYTRYDGPCEHMGEHCDKPQACAFALLSYLEAFVPAGAQPSQGLQLFVFRGDSSATPLAVRISARSNRVVVLNGAEQAHLRPPLDSGQFVMLLAGCFQR